MFFQELKDFFEVWGISKKEDIEAIERGNVFIKKDGKEYNLKGNFIVAETFSHSFDFLFFTVPNPVRDVIYFYFKKIKEKNFNIPAIFLSQNGVEAGEETILVLKEIFGEKCSEIPVFRISLFNAIDKFRSEDGKIFFTYFLPIKMAISQISGPTLDVSFIFNAQNFKTFFINSRDAKNMEYSKLFLNLIGMACAVRGLSLREGFLKEDIFKEEILALREYAKVVKRLGGKFLNFPGYPVRFFSLLIFLPFQFLYALRYVFIKKIDRLRIGKKKDLGEIDYYNGAVLRMAQKLKMETPMNLKILEGARPRSQLD